jgi:hypothetical protein
LKPECGHHQTAKNINQKIPRTNIKFALLPICAGPRADYDAGQAEECTHEEEMP